MMTHEDRLMFLLRVLEGTDPPDLRFILEETLRSLLDREVDRVAEEERRSGQSTATSTVEDAALQGRVAELKNEVDGLLEENKDLSVREKELAAKCAVMERQVTILDKVTHILQGLGPPVTDVVARATEVVHDGLEAVWNFQQLQASHASARTEVERLTRENDSLRQLRDTIGIADE